MADSGGGRPATLGEGWAVARPPSGGYRATAGRGHPRKERPDVVFTTTPASRLSVSGNRTVRAAIGRSQLAAFVEVRDFGGQHHLPLRVRFIPALDHVDAIGVGRDGQQFALADEPAGG